MSVTIGNANENPTPRRDGKAVYCKPPSAGSGCYTFWRFENVSRRFGIHRHARVQCKCVATPSPHIPTRRNVRYSRSRSNAEYRIQNTERNTIFTPHDSRFSHATTPPHSVLPVSPLCLAPRLGRGRRGSARDSAGAAQRAARRAAPLRSTDGGFTAVLKVTNRLVKKVVKHLSPSSAPTLL